MEVGGSMKKPRLDAPGLSGKASLVYKKNCSKRIYYLYPLLLFAFLNSLLFSQPLLYAEVHEASATPWSGYWWPHSSGGLATGLDYRGHPAPLEKYELLTLGIYPGQLVSWYEDNYYDPDAPGWYGLCAYWAWAASYEQIEIFPSSEENIIFRVGDKKGLITLAHTNDFIESASGHSPDVFHYWLLHYIKDQGKAFVADLDSGSQVWSYPIFKYEMESTVNAGTETVAVKIFYSDDLVRPDYMGAKIKSKTYTYILFLNGNDVITGGEWTGFSINDHPQRLTFPIMANNSCPYLDYEEVLRLAESKDDFLEKPDQIVDISAGTYNLILLNEDIYKIECLSGDTVRIFVEKQSGSDEDMTVIVTDSREDEIIDSVVSEHNPINLIITGEDPPYLVTITQTDYSDPNIYTLKVDLKGIYHQNVPYIPKHGMWSGFALTNPNEIEAERVTLTTRTADGQPLQTVLGPLSIAPGERRLFFFNDLPWYLHELSNTDKLTLTSDIPVNLLNLFGNTSDSLACFVQGRSRGNHLIIPDTLPPMTPGRNMFGEVANESFEEAAVSLYLYSEEGTLLSEKSEVLNPRGTLSIRPGSYPFYNMPDRGWIEIIGAGDQVLSGYQYLRFAGKAESIFALPVGSSQKIVPHIPPPGYWITTVTLINPNDLENRVNFHLETAKDDHSEDLTVILAPREKMALELQDLYGKYEGDPSYHSIIKIDGEYPLAGYYTFSTPQDEASIPLLDQNDFNRELILPHYPGNNGYWWTGIGVCNPSSFSVTVRVMPYDGNGNLMESHEKGLNLAPGAYEVFLVGSFFGEAAAEISFVKFCVEDTRGFIAGFYLYGNRSEKMLSGTNM